MKPDPVNSGNSDDTVVINELLKEVSSLKEQNMRLVDRLAIYEKQDQAERSQPRKIADTSIDEMISGIRETIHLLPCGIGIVDRDYNIIFYNREFKEILNLTDDELAHREYLNYRYLKNDGSVLSVENGPLAVAFRDKQDISDARVGIVKKDDSVLWADLSAFRLPVNDFYAMVILLDVTEEKNAEDHREELLKEIKESNAELAAILDITTSVAGKLTLDDMLNDLLRQLIRILNADTCMILLRDRNMIKVRAHVGIDMDTLENYSTPSGYGPSGTIVQTATPYFIEDSHSEDTANSSYLKVMGVRSMLGVPIKDGDSVIGVIHVNWRNVHQFSQRDLHILQVSAERCSSAIINSRLYERTRELAQQAELYVDLMGHDINNMNQIAMGYLEMISEWFDMDEERKEMIQRPIDVLIRSSRLIANVRLLQNISIHNQHLEIVDLGKVLREVIRQYPVMKNKHVKIDHVPGYQCYVKADALLSEIFLNLIANSIKHSNSQDVRITLSLEQIIHDDRMYYKTTVEDNGPGIPDDLKTRLFDRGLKGNTKAKGSGIGLFLVKKLVMNYNGHIWVEDRVKGERTRGSKFVVLLPLAVKIKY